jgi:non-specific serine/threonine protein kinase
VKAIELKGFSPTCLALFQREIEIHRTLDHEHIVRCYDVFRTETHIYMVLEYCPHGDLSQFITQKRKVPEQTVTDIMDQILSGYRHLASLKILHRDLKPSNILRCGKIWKIADFGFAVRASSGFTDSINVGTPMYMAV